MTDFLTKARRLLPGSTILYLNEKAGQEWGALSRVVFDPPHHGQENGLLVHHVQLVSSFKGRKCNPQLPIPYNLGERLRL